MPLDDQSELFYWVDENDKVIGSITRANAHDGSRKIHRAISVLITNESGEVLLQKRSYNKDLNPGFWAESVGGHVNYQESYQDAAYRETQEELGLDLPLIYLAKDLVDLENEREYFHLYQGTYQKGPIRFDKQEIDEIRWVKLHQLSHFMQDHPLTTSCLQSLKKVGFI